ncbi:MAG: IclR family transcriptional regulator, partial [Hyphomicrobiales bacterium]
MASNGSADAAMKHRIPVIDRMMDVLAQLERREGGATIRDLVSALQLPRTTIYRILNTLQLHDMVHRDDAGAYALGSRLLTLAAHVASGAGQVDLVAIAQPVMDRLSGDVGEACKLTVIDKDGTLVIAAASARREYALSVTPGQRLAAHAGAAGKLLLAYLPEPDRKDWLSRPMAAFTPRTLTDPKRLSSELTRIRRLGWSQDKGEGLASVLAYAAPIFDSRNQMIAALSIPFLAGTEPSRMEDIRLAAIAAA